MQRFSGAQQIEIWAMQHKDFTGQGAGPSD
jgi:hypothetical protein